MSAVNQAPARPPAKRPRAVISCLECRRKKLKCSRTRPCQQCSKIGRPGRCAFQAGQEPEANADHGGITSTFNKRQRLLPPPTVPNGSEAAPGLTHAWRPLPPTAQQGVIEDLQKRVTRLEQALLMQQSSDSVVHQPSSKHSCLSKLSEQGRALVRSSSISSQVRTNSIVPLHHLENREITRLTAVVQRCLYLSLQATGRARHGWTATRTEDSTLFGRVESS